MPTVRHHGGTNIHFAALHLAFQQGIQLLTKAPMMSKCCNIVVALLPDWHAERLLEGTRACNGKCRGHHAEKAIGSCVCQYGFGTKFHSLMCRVPASTCLHTLCNAAWWVPTDFGTIQLCKT